eukprot:3394438-Pleurochrysis_carterae.AAC.1
MMDYILFGLCILLAIRHEIASCESDAAASFSTAQCNAAGTTPVLFAPPPRCACAVTAHT